MPGALAATVDVQWCPGLNAVDVAEYAVLLLLAHHPKVIATAHDAALTTSYFRRAAQALGDALAAQLDRRRPPNALKGPIQARAKLAR